MSMQTFVAEIERRVKKDAAIASEWTRLAEKHAVGQIPAPPNFAAWVEEQKK